MSPTSRHHVLRPLVIAVAAFVAVGCGGSDDGSDVGGGSGPASLTHLDGTLTQQGETYVLTPKEGGEPKEFTLGPEVPAAQAAAIVSSGEPARVTYREGETVAASIGPAPKAGEGVEAYEGLVVSVDDAAIVISGDDGERTFDISGADAGAFDSAHLEEHQQAGEAIRVYFRSDAPDAGISYEDA